MNNDDARHASRPFIASPNAMCQPEKKDDNEMATTTTRKPRTRKPAAAKVDVPDIDTSPVDVIDAVLSDLDETADPVIDAPADVPVPTKSRKYFSHANCTHARKGEAGKAARATCRRNIRAWLNAEAEYLASIAA